MKKLTYLLLTAMSVVLLYSCTSNETDLRGEIYGMVSESGTAEPMRGISVELYTSPSDNFMYDQPGGALLLKTVTYDDGHYEFTDLAPGNYQLVINAEGYQTAKYSVLVEAGRTARADMQLTRRDTYMTVRTLSATDIQGDRATLNGQCTSSSSYRPKELGFVYSTSPTPQNGGTTIKCDNTFSHTISGLQKGQYYFQAYAKNDLGTEYGDVQSFEITGQPSVSTLKATNITKNTATLNGLIDYAGTPAYTERGFVYSANYPNPTVDDPESATTKIVVTGTSKEFSANIAALTENTTYNVRAYARNSDGVVYGKSLSFVTDDEGYIIIDNLVIQTSDLSAGASVESAQEICAKSRVGGFDDWRLPTIGELSIIYTNRAKIKRLSNSKYWSSTTSSYAHEYFALDFNNGLTDHYSRSNTFRVRAVRTVR